MYENNYNIFNICFDNDFQKINNELTFLLSKENFNIFKNKIEMYNDILYRRLSVFDKEIYIFHIFIYCLNRAYSENNFNFENNYFFNNIYHANVFYYFSNLKQIKKYFKDLVSSLYDQLLISYRFDKKRYTYLKKVNKKLFVNEVLFVFFKTYLLKIDFDIFENMFESNDMIDVKYTFDYDQYIDIIVGELLKDIDLNSNLIQVVDHNLYLQNISMRDYIYELSLSIIEFEDLKYYDETKKLMNYKYSTFLINPLYKFLNQMEDNNIYVSNFKFESNSFFNLIQEYKYINKLFNSLRISSNIKYDKHEYNNLVNNLTSIIKRKLNKYFSEEYSYSVSYELSSKLIHDIYSAKYMSLFNFTEFSIDYKLFNYEFLEFINNFLEIKYG